MSVQKILFCLLMLAALVFVVQMVFMPSPEAPPNPRVNEVAFEQLLVGMTELQVEAVIGIPHSTAGGEIIKVEGAVLSEAGYAISELQRNPGCDLLNFYRGPDDESIRALFSAKDRSLVAYEYRICERAVLYRGPKPVGIKSTPVLLASGERGVNPDLDRKISNFFRRRDLRKPSGPPVPTTTTDPQPPLPPPAPAQSLDNPIPAGGVVGASPMTDDPPMPATPERPGDPPAPGDGGPRLPDLCVKLPTGEKLTKTMFDLQPGWQDSLFPDESLVHVVNHPNGNVEGVLNSRENRLHEYAAVLYEDGRLSTLASYQEGKRNGPLRMWNEDRQRLLYAEFRNDLKQGVLCFFREGNPCLLQKWDKNRLAAQYFLIADTGGHRAVAEADLTGAAKSDWDKAVKELGELEAKLKEKEAKLKLDLAAWYRKMKSRKSATPNPALWRAALQGCGF